MAFDKRLEAVHANARAAGVHGAGDLNKLSKDDLVLLVIELGAVARAMDERLAKAAKEYRKIRKLRRAA